MNSFLRCMFHVIIFYENDINICKVSIVLKISYEL